MKQVGSPPLPLALVALQHALADDGISSLDPNVPAAIWRRALAEPAGEFLARPGKALRTMIVNTGWALGGGSGEAPDRLALALELLHAGSLVIDDVEDGSTERRGAPALHCTYGVPLAINTGSWMYFWALAELAEVSDALVGIASRALVRCHQGQALDLGVRITDIDRGDVPAVVAATTKMKTGALCRLAAELGAHAAGADAQRVSEIGTFAERMGTGLQMLDDLGSITCPDRRAKGLEDLRAARPTWPWAWLAETAHWERVTQIEDIDARCDALAFRTSAVGHARIRRVLDGALLDLNTACGSHPMISRIATELARMERSYG